MVTLPIFRGLLQETIPTREMNLWDRKGSIETGKDADLVLLDDEANMVPVLSRSRKVK